VRIHQSIPLLVLAATLCSGCGDPVARNVDTIVAGGEGREEARMELLFAKAEALSVIIATLADTTRAAVGRADWPATT
jgi:hypothetical protein